MTGTAEAGASRLIAKLEADGFTRTEHGRVALLHHRAFRLSRFGMVDTVVGIALEPGVATEASFVALDKETKQGAMSVKSKWPLGLGSAVEMFPVLFAETADAAAIAAANGASPKRWGIMSSHALVHGSPAQIELFDGRAIWGAAYVASQRKKLKQYLA